MSSSDDDEEENIFASGRTQSVVFSPTAASPKDVGDGEGGSGPKGPNFPSLLLTTEDSLTIKERCQKYLRGFRKNRGAFEVFPNCVKPQKGEYLELIYNLLCVGVGLAHAPSPSEILSAVAAPPGSSQASEKKKEEGGSGDAKQEEGVDDEEGGGEKVPIKVPMYYQFETIKSLCTAVNAVLASEPTCLKVQVGDDTPLQGPTAPPTPPSTSPSSPQQEGEQEDPLEPELLVVGDIHGQFCDFVQSVFSMQLLANEANARRPRTYLFLGDYVDRGPMGVETMMLLFALKVEYPKSVYIIRGNHEDAETTMLYGFARECRAKFPMVSGNADPLTQFLTSFCYIPLAARVSQAPNARRESERDGDKEQPTNGNSADEELVIAASAATTKTTPAMAHRSFLCVHGGLSPSLTTIQTLDEIERTDYGGTLDNESAEIVDGLMWSDPTQMQPRYGRNDRGCGFTFGPAATAEFCDINGLDFLCRAHQMTMKGYLWTHADRCLTVFSAPNYCNMSDNKGAVMIVRARTWSFGFVQFIGLTSPAMVEATRAKEAASVAATKEGGGDQVSSEEASEQSSNSNSAAAGPKKSVVGDLSKYFA